jgi:hypothetical protein
MTALEYALVVMLVLLSGNLFEAILRRLLFRI